MELIIFVVTRKFIRKERNSAKRFLETNLKEKPSRVIPTGLVCEKLRELQSSM